MPDNDAADDGPVEMSYDVARSPPWAILDNDAMDDGPVDVSNDVARQRLFVDDFVLSMPSNGRSRLAAFDDGPSNMPTSHSRAILATTTSSPSREDDREDDEDGANVTRSDE